MDCSRKWIVDFNVGKSQLVSFDWCSYEVMVGSVLEEKLSFKILGLTWLLG